MFLIPSAQTPLNQHSLEALEAWFSELGACQSRHDPCLWIWEMPNWTAQIQMERDELQVTWNKVGQVNHCSFSYGLSRHDVEIVIAEGP